MEDGSSKKQSRIDRKSINSIFLTLIISILIVSGWIVYDLLAGGESYSDFIPLLGSLVIASITIITLRISWDSQQKERLEASASAEQERISRKNNELADIVEEYFFNIHKLIWILADTTIKSPNLELKSVNPKFLNAFTKFSFPYLSFSEDNLVTYFKVLHVWLDGEQLVPDETTSYMQLLSALGYLRDSNQVIADELGLVERFISDNLKSKEKISGEERTAQDVFNDNIQAYDSISSLIYANYFRVKTLIMLVMYYNNVKDQVEQRANVFIGTGRDLVIPSLETDHIRKAVLMAEEMEVEVPDLDLFLKSVERSE
ncbi:MAG: hypothetical protein JJU03_12610 [Idiomarina sp.]|nr:hypothetical protein [Idiomarina sp.]